MNKEQELAIERLSKIKTKIIQLESKKRYISKWKNSPNCVRICESYYNFDDELFNTIKRIAMANVCSNIHKATRILEKELKTLGTK